ncbi:GNAT family N-acetyltransferase [Lentzea guizhouensis]|uniref:GNAT family N-acetyltransferase n=1 Tax=Lentzea guizhouensis TaxID=1586287 RepID=A0A1B2HKL8_9PSEU|nr:GNAT family N-acetyltransferase [Lentzea guizhouensis]ANZ38230.1 GNAT family N-acetyltransferase [Lentzea guizhouensis]
MTDLLIRPAREADLAAVGALTLSAYRGDGLLVSESYGEQLTDAATRHRDAELLVAVDDDGEVLGSVTVALPGTPFAEISAPGEVEFRMLAVSPAARGRGVGEALVHAVCNRALAAGATRVVLSSSPAMRSAHRLYERLGFARAPERDWSPLPGVVLVAYTREV